MGNAVRASNRSLTVAVQKYGMRFALGNRSLTVAVQKGRSRFRKAYGYLIDGGGENFGNSTP